MCLRRGDGAAAACVLRDAPRGARPGNARFRRSATHLDELLEGLNYYRVDIRHRRGGVAVAECKRSGKSTASRVSVEAECASMCTALLRR
jgi:hypothetical protein